MESLNALLEPGTRVQHPQYPEWGVGQVQSNIGGKVTVNFPEQGKVVVQGPHVELIVIY